MGAAVPAIQAPLGRRDAADQAENVFVSLDTPRPSHGLHVRGHPHPACGSITSIRPTGRKRPTRASIRYGRRARASTGWMDGGAVDPVRSCASTTAGADLGLHRALRSQPERRRLLGPHSAHRDGVVVTLWRATRPSGVAPSRRLELLRTSRAPPRSAATRTRQPVPDGRSVAGVSART